MALLWLYIDVLEMEVHPKESNSNLTPSPPQQADIYYFGKNWSQHFYIIIFLKQT